MHSNLRITSIKMINTNNNKIPCLHNLVLLRAEFKKKKSLVFAQDPTIRGDFLTLQWNDYQASGNMPGAKCIQIQFKWKKKSVQDLNQVIICQYYYTHKEHTHSHTDEHTPIQA